MAKKKSTVHRRMISVPVDLQKRMSKHSEVNWSGIAADAFEKKLNQLTQQKEVRNMAGMIERLRASKEQLVSVLYAAGQKAGEEWARDTADFDELRRLESLCEQQGSNWEGWFESGENDSFPSGYRLAAVIADEQASRVGGDGFWDVAIGEDEEHQDWRRNDDFVRGFADGALEAFDRVKDHL